jgi:hypothetical protein
MIATQYPLFSARASTRVPGYNNFQMNINELALVNKKPLTSVNDIKSHGHKYVSRMS